MSPILDQALEAAHAAALFTEAARARAAQAVAPSGTLDGVACDREQRLLHGFAWIATTSAALAALADWGCRGEAAGRSRPLDALVIRIGFGEYLQQLLGGVPMSQNEMVRPGELGLDEAARRLADTPAVKTFLSGGNVAEARAELVGLLAEGARPDEALDDETLDLVREQFRGFTAARIAPHATAGIWPTP